MEDWRGGNHNPTQVLTQRYSSPVWNLVAQPARKWGVWYVWHHAMRRLDGSVGNATRCRRCNALFVFFSREFPSKIHSEKVSSINVGGIYIIIFSFYFKYFIVFLRPKDFSDCRTQWYDSLWFTNHYRITWVEGYLISYKYNMLFCKGWVFWVFNW